MSPIGCAELQELGPELALGVLTGEERAEALLHVADCARCQAFVDELAKTADQLSLLVGDIEPPAGFGRRVHQAIDRPRRVARWRRAALVATTAAAAAIASVAIVRVVDANDDGRLVAPGLRTVSMTGWDGHEVGHVAVTGGSPADLAVFVADYVVPDAVYVLEFVRDDRVDAVKVGEIEVVEGRGMWHGRVASARGTLRMVDDDGLTLCRARLVGSRSDS